MLPYKAKISKVILSGGFLRQAMFCEGKEIMIFLKKKLFWGLRGGSDAVW